MNLSNIKTDVTGYHDVKDVLAALKTRNIGAFGAALSVFLAWLLPIVQPLGAKHGFTIDAVWMGYVHDGLLGLAGLCLTPHLRPGPAVALVTSDGAPGRSPASGQGPLDPSVGSRPTVAAAPGPVRVGPSSSDPTEGTVLGG